jgi:hypothetical protein
MERLRVSIYSSCIQLKQHVFFGKKNSKPNKFSIFKNQKKKLKAKNKQLKQKKKNYTK